MLVQSTRPQSGDEGRTAVDRNKRRREGEGERTKAGGVQGEDATAASRDDTGRKGTTRNKNKRDGSARRRRGEMAARTSTLRWLRSERDTPLSRPVATATFPSATSSTTTVKREGSRRPTLNRNDEKTRKGRRCQQPWESAKWVYIRNRERQQKGLRKCEGGEGREEGGGSCMLGKTRVCEKGMG